MPKKKELSQKLSFEKLLFASKSITKKKSLLIIIIYQTTGTCTK